MLSFDLLRGVHELTEWIARSYKMRRRSNTVGLVSKVSLVINAIPVNME